jgi:crotonobetainyl-CoA:carnitine CoA-transferase CaiB-like acyl-CoA transferase
VLGVPTKLSATPGAVRSAPPLLGQHTRDVLERDLGFEPAEIARLAGEGAIALAGQTP